MPEYRFSATRIFPYKDGIEDTVQSKNRILAYFAQLMSQKLVFVPETLPKL